MKMVKRYAWAFRRVNTAAGVYVSVGNITFTPIFNITLVGMHVGLDANDQVTDQGIDGIAQFGLAIPGSPSNPGLSVTTYGSGPVVPCRSGQPFTTEIYNELPANEAFLFTFVVNLYTVTANIIEVDLTMNLAYLVPEDSLSVRLPAG